MQISILLEMKRVTEKKETNKKRKNRRKKYFRCGLFMIHSPKWCTFGYHTINLNQSNLFFLLFYFFIYFIQSVWNLYKVDLMFLGKFQILSRHSQFTILFLNHIWYNRQISIVYFFPFFDYG